ncbi:MAG: CRISPR-associated endoribonuclease Cas6 [Veillonellales bacterium]
MHLYIQLESPSGLEVPVHYNHIVQAVLYQTIDADLAKFLHDSGFVSQGRTFKLFCFSRLRGSFAKNGAANNLIFRDKIQLVITSPVEEFCQSLANGLLKKGTLLFGRQPVEVKEIQVEQPRAEDEVTQLRTLSPIVAYSTLLRPDGRKYTCYFQPGDPDYNSLITGNLRKKFQACYGREAPAGEVRVDKRGELRQNIIRYKETIIKGYSGRIRLTGPKELLQMALDAGLGSKNSQGFGCVEMEKPRR